MAPIRDQRRGDRTGTRLTDATPSGPNAIGNGEFRAEVSGQNGDTRDINQTGAYAGTKSLGQEHLIIVMGDTQHHVSEDDHEGTSRQ